MRALTSPPTHALPHDPRRVTEMVLAVADTGATHHMIPDRAAFVSYHRSDRRVRMASNTYAPVLGEGTAVISLNGHNVLIRNALHVPALRKPLYSLRAHVKQKGCGFIGDEGLGGMLVYFPTFCLSVDLTVDSHLDYRTVGRAVPLSRIDYGQPRPRAASATEQGASASRVTTRSASALRGPSGAPSEPTADPSRAPSEPLPGSPPVSPAAPVPEAPDETSLPPAAPAASDLSCPDTLSELQRVMFIFSITLDPQTQCYYRWILLPTLELICNHLKNSTEQYSYYISYYIS